MSARAPVEGPARVSAGTGLERLHAGVPDAGSIAWVSGTRPSGVGRRIADVSQHRAGVVLDGQVTDGDDAHEATVLDDPHKPFAGTP